MGNQLNDDAIIHVTRNTGKGGLRDITVDGPVEEKTQLASVLSF